LNGTYDGTHSYASGSYVRRKMPILAPALGAYGSASDHLQGRLRQGYETMLGGGVASGGGGLTTNGIERM
jgi:hypothetical protein